MDEREKPACRRGMRPKKRRRAFLFWAVLLLLSAGTVCWGIREAFRAAPLSGDILSGRESLKVAGIPPRNADPVRVKIEDVPWYLALVNRWNPLPEDYGVDLVEVPGGEKVDERIYDPLMEMLDAAEAEELDPIVISGFRTEEEQQELYRDKIREYRWEGCSQEEAAELAKEWVAAPGTSEHQLGLAVDIKGSAYDIYLWLEENSWEYGFIFRYPAYKTDLTGVAGEVWHYRYVGKEAAQEIHEQGVCLEEYLENRQTDR